jgi:hypothetical protein
VTSTKNLTLFRRSIHAIENFSAHTYQVGILIGDTGKSGPRFRMQPTLGQSPPALIEKHIQNRTSPRFGDEM